MSFLRMQCVIVWCIVRNGIINSVSAFNDLFYKIGELMKRYDGLVSFLSDIQEFLGKSNSEMSACININPRTYRQWKAGKDDVKIGSLKLIAQNLQIPFEVLIRLQHGYPTYYNEFNHRYSINPFSKGFINSKILKQQLYETSFRGNIFKMSKNEDFEDVIDSPFPDYIKKASVDGQNLKKNILKNNNYCYIIRDQFGYYNGHVLCFPVINEFLDKIRTGEIKENNLVSKYIIDEVTEEPITIYLYSFHATTSVYAYCLLKKFFEKINQNIDRKIINEDSVIARHTGTRDGFEFCHKMGMDVYPDEEAFDKTMHEIEPALFIKKISEMTWLREYADQIIKLKYKKN